MTIKRIVQVNRAETFTRVGVGEPFGASGTVLPAGPAGAGFDGWTPVLALEPDGLRRVLRVMDWVGGTTAKPAIGQFLGSNGYTTVVDQAIDLRGPGANEALSDALDIMIQGGHLGDMIVRGETGWQRLPIGGAGQALVAKAGGQVAWDFLAASASPPQNFALPSISGTTTQGQTLTANPGVWTGNPTPTYGFQWSRGGAAISGATAQTYTLQAADVAATISVLVTATNSQAAVSASSLATAAIAPLLVIPANTVLPTISGTAIEGQTLTGSNGAWTGSPTPSFTYQWLRAGSAISGATSASYILTSADVGATLTFAVTATSAAGARTVASLPTAVVTSNQQLPINTALPTITGAANEGSTLTASQGGWAAGPTPSFSYQWKRDGVAISGATGTSYLIAAADVGHVLTVTVTATNVAGAVTATSAATATITSIAAPSLVSAPVITGTATDGNILSASQAAWSESALAAPVNTVAPSISGQTTLGSTLALTSVGIDPTNLAGTASQTFSDDFASLSLWNGSTGTWSTNVWFGAANGFSQNNELEWYIDATYSGTASVTPWTVSAGVLTITADVAASGVQPLINNYAYTSGIMTTFTSFSQTYGYFEIKAKLPAGQGLWPAFWMLPVDKTWPPEIDIFENLGQDMTHYYATTHSNATGTHTQQSATITTPDLSAAFHTYGVNWQADTITYYFDGAQVAQHPTPSDLLNRPCYLLINLAVGGWPGAPASNAIFPARYQVDYVKAYKALNSNAWTGNPAPSFTYQWKRDGASISGATNPTYTIVTADQGHSITLAVTGTNSQSSATATSNAIAVPAAVGGGGGSGGTSTWSPTDKSASWTLSNSNLTASISTSTSQHGIRATVGRPANDATLRRVSVTVDTLTAEKLAIGLTPSSTPLDADDSYFSASSISYLFNGWAVANGSFDTGHTAVTAGDIVSVEIQNSSCTFKVNGVTQGVFDISGMGSSTIYPFVYGQSASGSLVVSGNFVNW